MSYRPFIDAPPFQLHDYWYLLLIPMAIGVSLAYKAIRCHAMNNYRREVIVMSLQIILGMAFLALASYLLIGIYLRYLAHFFVGA